MGTRSALGSNEKGEIARGKRIEKRKRLVNGGGQEKQQRSGAGRVWRKRLTGWQRGLDPGEEAM